MKHYILALVLIMASINAAIVANPVRKGNVTSGHVLVKNSEENIPYATILIVGSGQGAVSNGEGQLEPKNLPTGRYTLCTSTVGYKIQEKEIEVNKGSTAAIRFQTQEENFMADEVIVSANHNEVSRKAAPVVVNMVSIKLSEMTNFTGLAETLSYQLGLHMENNCQNCGFPQMRISGLEGSCSQILINSHPIISALNGVYGLKRVPVSMIERVEVIRGGDSTLFGMNAVGGTIDVITRNPINNSFQVSSMLSDMGDKSWKQYMGVNVSLVAKDSFYGIAPYESHRNRNPHDCDGDGFLEPGKLNMNTFGFRAYYRPMCFSRINLKYHTTNKFRCGGDKFDLQLHETDITEQTKHIINNGGLGYNLFWREYKHKTSLHGSIQHTDRSSYCGAQKDLNAYGKTSNLTWVTSGMYVDNMDNCFLAPAAFIDGLEYQNNPMHDMMTGCHRDMQQDVRIVSAFVQNEWKMNILTILVGARLNKCNLIGKLISSPRVNLFYKPSEDFQARLTYSTGFRTPQVYDEGLYVIVMDGEGVQTKLADSLCEGRSNSYSESVDWTTRSRYWQTNILVKSSYTDLYYASVLKDIGKNDIDDAIKERRNSNGARVYRANLDARIVHSKEAQFQLGFTAQHSRYTHEEAWTKTDSVDLTIKRMPRTPGYCGHFTFSSASTKNSDFSLSGTYTGKTIVPHYAGYIEKDRMESTPQFFDFNLKSNYTFVLHDHVRFQLSTSVRNIFNSLQKDLDEGELRDAGYFYDPT